MSEQENINSLANRRGNFTQQADAYHAARPNYPAALIEQLIQQLQLPRDANVADIGAGTGIFTSQLAEHDFNITAVEPNPAMSSKALNLLNVRWVEGTFEETFLPDNSQDWATAAQSFHWADPERALPELHRILKPGGAFTSLWNNRLNDEEPTLARTWDLIRTTVPDFNDTYRDNDNWQDVLTSSGLFENVTYIEQRHTIEMPRDRFVALWQSHNNLTVSAGPRRFNDLMQQIKQDLDDRNVEVVPMPYLCRAWTAKRRDK